MRMNNGGQITLVSRICRPYGADKVGGILATKMPLLTELEAISDIRLFYENDARFLKQF
jgi:hypothetical protein